jgi:thiol-disulfide isomerase/thioredoxin
MRNWTPGVKGPAVLFIKAEWCPHCQHAKPEMERASAMLSSAIPLYAVDSERHARHIKQWGVDGFPTIAYLDESNRMHRYDGERRGQNVADWACITSGKCAARRR